MHCWEIEIRLLAVLVFDEGKQRHFCDWERREPNTSNVTHTATINLSFVISLATTYKPVALNPHQLTDTNVDKYAQKERQQKPLSHYFPTKGHDTLEGRTERRREHRKRAAGAKQLKTVRLLLSLEQTFCSLLWSDIHLKLLNNLAAPPLPTGQLQHHH